VALATAVVLATPASAQAAGQTSAFGLSGSGVVVVGPISPSNFPAGPPSDSVASAAVPPGGATAVLTTGVLATTSAKTGATANVATVKLAPSPTSSLTASAVSSMCAVDPTTGQVSGSAAILNGAITGVTGAPPLNAAPPANTTIPLGPLGDVVLNRQTVNPTTRTLTVDAIYISLAPGTPLAQVITIASTTCTPAVIAAAPAPTVAPAPPAARAPAPAAAAPQVLAPVGGVNTGGGPPPASFLDSPLLGVLGGLLLSAGAALGLVTYRRRLAGEK